jgi:nicotinamide mononucleotide transporter
MSILEIFASILGIISVWLLIKQNMWCWPTGILMVIIYSYIFFKVQLYSDMLLQIFFALMQGYGWYYWLNGEKKNQKLNITFLRRSEMVQWFIVFVLFSLVLGLVMRKYTNADLPFIDAATATMSIIAQWLMTKKIIENWIVWILADIVYVGIYFYKDLYPTAVLYLLFLGMAFMGYREWLEKSREPSKV